jgi:MFS transporter, PAT family, beta-lactamase induction signal transducer AmpG
VKQSATATSSWRQSLAVYLNGRMAVVFALGMCSGLPNGLITGTLGVWLRDYGLSRTDIGLVGLIGLVYAINFLWAPLLDRLRPPGLGRMGRRRGWIVLFQCGLLGALLLMPGMDPVGRLQALVLLIATIAVLSASQDVVIDAFRVEYLKPDEYAAGSAMATMGWLTGATIVGGFMVLHLSGSIGWEYAYVVAGVVLLMGPLVLWLAGEPVLDVSIVGSQIGDSWRKRLHDTMIAPFAEFLGRPHAWLVLAFVLLFKLGEAMLGRMTGVFYIDLGFSPGEIANYSKLLGTAAMLAGGAIGGVVAKRYGLFRALLASAILMAATNLLYAWLALVGKNFDVLAIAIVADNLTTGLSLSIFVAFVSSLCNVAFTATQYALLSSLANIAMRGAASMGGVMVDSLEASAWTTTQGQAWATFFVVTAVMAAPGIILLLFLRSRLGELMPPR